MVESRVIEVPAERIVRWVAGFSARHGEFVMQIADDGATLSAADGATAVLAVPFPPVREVQEASAIESFAEHALVPRRVGMLLVRLGGYAVGVFDSGELVSSKVGSRPVHGRAAAGGWSQHRFARRREGQVRVALSAAANTAAAILLPVRESLDAIVTGGDRQAIRTVLADARLGSLSAIVVSRVLDVPDPRLSVLRRSFQSASAIRVLVTDPA